MHDDKHEPHPNATKEFSKAWEDWNSKNQNGLDNYDLSMQDVFDWITESKGDEAIPVHEVLDWIQFSPFSIGHPELLTAVAYFSSQHKSDPQNKEASEFLDLLLDAIRGDDLGKLENMRKDAVLLKPTIGRLQALQKAKKK